MDLAVKLLPLTLVILAVVVLWWFTRRRNKLRPEMADVRGFRGWLLLLAIVQWILLLRVIGDFATALPDYQKHWADPIVRRAILGESGLTLGMFVFTAYSTFMMTMKRRIFPALFRIELVLIVFLPFLSLLFIAQLTALPLEHFPLGNAVIQAVVTAISATIWILYSLNSMRVRNTFTN